jgi:sugar transferase (PEP-CTERM/EpsH1 system associated)
MKVLIVSEIFPSPTSGNRSRNYYLLKMLARQHTVSLLTLEEGTAIQMPRDVVPLESLTHWMEVIPYHRSPPQFKRLKQLVNVISGKSDILNVPGTKALLNALDLLFVRDPYDAVLFEGTLNSYYRLPEHVKVIIDKHNIEFELLERLSLNETRWFRKWYNGREYRFVKPVEIKQCRDADAVAVTSERERLLLKSLLPNNVIEVVPNGVDIEYFHGSDAEQEVNGRIVFTGAMDYYPNAEAVLFFAQKCWPLIRARMPGATWQIVGKNPRPDVQKLAKLPGITVTGSVADVRPSFAEAGVAIVPLLLGGGTRLKILEAMAMRKAVVSTSLGCEGLSAVPGKHLIVADQPEVFAQAVIELLKNPEKRRALGTAGRALVESAYSWERCGDRLLHILEQMK